MPTLLDELLAGIQPARIREKLLARMDDAINAFRIERNRLTDAIEYRDQVCRFVRQLDRHMAITPTSELLPDNVVWQRASRLLRKAYGTHGETAAYETQRAGAEGGFHGVLRRLATAAADEGIDKDIATRVDSFCKRLSADDYLAVGREYLEKHGHLLPAEMSEGSATRARLNLAALLKQHHRLLVATHGVGR